MKVFLLASFFFIAGANANPAKVSEAPDTSNVPKMSFEKAYDQWTLTLNNFVANKKDAKTAPQNIWDAAIIVFHSRTDYFDYFESLSTEVVEKIYDPQAPKDLKKRLQESWDAETKGNKLNKERLTIEGKPMIEMILTKPGEEH